MAVQATAGPSSIGIAVNCHSPKVGAAANTLVRSLHQSKSTAMVATEAHTVVAKARAGEASAFWPVSKMEMETMPIAIGEVVPRVIVLRIIDLGLVLELELVNVSTFAAMPSVVVSLTFVSRTQNDSTLAELVPLLLLLGKVWKRIIAMIASMVGGISMVTISSHQKLSVVAGNR